jgi:hypothetical protein
MRKETLSARPLSVAILADSCRSISGHNKILDQIIALNEGHLRRVLRDYVIYYEQDRLHGILDKDAPNRRAVEQRLGTDATVISHPRLGGLHTVTPGAKRRSRFSKFLRIRLGNLPSESAECSPSDTSERHSLTCLG